MILLRFMSITLRCFQVKKKVENECFRVQVVGPYFTAYFTATFK